MAVMKFLIYFMENPETITHFLLRHSFYSLSIWVKIMSIQQLVP
jgi:hypothetical protein